MLASSAAMKRRRKWEALPVARSSSASTPASKRCRMLCSSHRVSSASKTSVGSIPAPPRQERHDAVADVDVDGVVETCTVAREARPHNRVGGDLPARPAGVEWREPRQFAGLHAVDAVRDAMELNGGAPALG